MLSKRLLQNHYSLVTVQGESFSRTLFLRKNGKLMNLSSSTVKASARSKIPQYTVVAEFDIDILDQSEDLGGIRLSLPPEVTQLIASRDVLDVDIVVNTGGEIFIVSGYTLQVNFSATLRD